MLCSFKKVAAASSSQNMTAKSLGQLPPAEDEKSEEARAAKNQVLFYSAG
jgi:hypothetical protein